MKVKVCEDLEYVKEVLFDDEMWGRCSDDYTIKDNKIIDGMGCLWLACYDEGRPVGVFSIKYNGSAAVNVHVHIPKKHRGKHSKSIGLMFLKWVKDNASENVQKLNTQVPVIYKDVIRFAKSLGFKKEGINTCSIMKDGQLIDSMYLGLKISEIVK